MGEKLRLMPPYEIPLEEYRCEIVVVNSRFFATLAAAFSVEQAREIISRVRSEFPDASHNVPAFLIGGGSSVIAHCSDDGEPSGTAGRPALAVLRGSGLGDAVLVVTRYFGGTKLGTGGLVRAYSAAAREAVEGVRRGRKIAVHVALIVLPYPFFERVRSLAARHHISIENEDFGADITLTLHIPVEQLLLFQDDLRQLSSGKLQAEIIETQELLAAVPGGAAD